MQLFDIFIIKNQFPNGSEISSIITQQRIQIHFQKILRKQKCLRNKSKALFHFVHSTG